MGARSLKPAFFLSRPCYSGTNSRSSRGDDTFVATTGLTMENESGIGPPGGSKRNQSPGSNLPPHIELAGKKSIPIAIQHPPKIARSYTPLTARGDLPGGYFPNHEQTDHRAQYIRGFADISRASSRYSPLDLAKMSTVSSAASSPFFYPQTTSSSLSSPQEPHLIPTGKYHPSNYQSPANTPSKVSYKSMYSSFNSLSIPIISKRDQARKKPQDRIELDKTSKKLHQYQQDMIAQAQKAVNNPHMSIWKPDGITLRPMNISIDGITPFELENEKNGYMAPHQQNRYEWKEKDILRPRS